MDAGQRTKGFTLTELLVVICVILILMSILVVGAGGVYTYAMRTKCQHRMEQVWHACQMYANNHGVLPRAYEPATSKLWYDTLFDAGYLDNRDAIRCPSSEIVATPGTGGESTGSRDEDEAYETVAKVLNWLKNHTVSHSASGGIYWNKGFTQAYEMGPGNVRPGSVALGILAYLGAGYDIDHPQYGETIRRALLYLIYEMNSTGEFNYYNLYEGYEQGVCTMALCDAYRLMGDVALAWPGGSYSLKEKAELAVQGTIDMQEPTHGALPYLSRTHYNDNSANVWGWQAIVSADAAGLADIDQAPLAGRRENYFTNCNDDVQLGTGGAGYAASGLSPNYYFRAWEHDPETPWRTTAAVLACRLLTGHDPDEQDCQDQLDWLSTSGYWYVDGATAETPDYMAWATRPRGYHSTNRVSGYYDLYMTYYMTLALYKVGGTEWTDWIQAVVPHLIDLATDGSSDEEEYYHADLVVHGDFAGHVYPSALAAMVLEMAHANMYPGSRWYWYEAGQHSYGYNELIANEEYRARKPANDTIILMDYVHDAIDANTDTKDDIAPRHGGKANVLFADGRVKAMTVDELIDPDTDTIKEGMLTLEPGD